MMKVHNIYCYIISLSFLVNACVDVNVPPASTLDAAMSVVGNTKTPEVIQESKNLYFQARSGYFAFNFSTQQEKLVCETGLARRSSDGERVLCIPESISSPLILTDPLLGPVFSLNEWNYSSFASPQISKDGKYFVSLIPQEDDLDHLAVYNEFGDELQKIKALILEGFAGPNHLVINDPPELWSFNDPLAELMPITDRKMIIHQSEPYGVVIEDDKKVYFLGVDASSSDLLLEGRLVDVKQQRVLTYDRAGNGDIELTLFDLLKNKVVATFSHPGISFSRELYLTLVSQDSVILAEQNSRSCGTDRIEYNVKSTLIDMSAGRRFVLVDNETPHQVVAHSKSPYAVISELDNCARPTGKSYLWNVKKSKKVDLPSELKDKVEEAVLSTLGEFIILRGAESLWIMDSESLSHRVIHGSEPILPGLDLD